MAIWFCRECRRAFHQDHMLPGWNGLWCPNCVWNAVTLVSDDAATAPNAPGLGETSLRPAPALQE